MAKQILPTTTRHPIFELNGRYFASADTTDAELANDLGLILAIVKDSLGNMAFDACEREGDEIEPRALAQSLYGLHYLASFAHGLHVEIEHRHVQANRAQSRCKTETEVTL